MYIHQPEMKLKVHNVSKIWLYYNYSLIVVIHLFQFVVMLFGILCIALAYKVNEIDNQKHRGNSNIEKVSLNESFIVTTDVKPIRLVNVNWWYKLRALKGAPYCLLIYKTMKTQNRFMIIFYVNRTFFGNSSRKGKYLKIYFLCHNPNPNHFIYYVLNTFKVE